MWYWMLNIMNRRQIQRQEIDFGGEGLNLLTFDKGSVNCACVHLIRSLNINIMSALWDHLRPSLFFSSVVIHCTSMHSLSQRSHSAPFSLIAIHQRAIIAMHDIFSVSVIIVLIKPQTFLWQSTGVILMQNMKHLCFSSDRAEVW